MQESIGGYRIVSSIGFGGMGCVYRAEQPGLRRLVAIKLLPQIFAPSEDLLDRFRREMEIHLRLSHPGLVKVLDAGVDGGQRFLVLELVEGVTLRSYMQATPELPLEFVLPVGTHLAEALAYLHQMGVVHRDVKPENVMVSHSGVVKIIDFGVARMEGEEEHGTGEALVGTLAYLSPEMARNRQAGPPADLYSLGVVLHEMLAGCRPCQGVSLEDWLDRIERGVIEPLTNHRPDLPAPLATLISQMMAREPGVL